MRVPVQVEEFGKKVLFRYTPLVRPSYPYCLEPLQLALIVDEMERLADMPGSILEIGVARGMTTRFIAEHIVQSGSNDKVFAIDTFSSFTQRDLSYEVEHRGKTPTELFAFGYNDFDTWAKNFSAFPFVTPVKADCATVDFQDFAPVKMALLDVDLYLPTKAALPRLHEALVGGGVILIDDVKPGGPWDGAYQAYMEYCEETGTTPDVVGTNCGVLRKP